jgi:Asp-tRNA(Asn)/Glu-tRNA(Gln) amidotransferase A subunit family amidase
MKRAGVDETTGLPIGVLLTGSRFSEDLCLDAAEVIEKRYRCRPRLIQQGERRHPTG